MSQLFLGEDEMIKSRVGDITTDLIQAIGKVCEKHNITHDEYRKAIDFFSEAIDAGERGTIESR